MAAAGPVDHHGVMPASSPGLHLASEHGESSSPGPPLPMGNSSAGSQHLPGQGFLSTVPSETSPALSLLLSLLSQVSDLCRDLKAARTSSCYLSLIRHFPKYSCASVIILVCSELHSHTHLSQLCLSNGWMLCVQFDFGQWSKRGTAFWASDAAWWGRRNRLKANSSSEKLILNSACIQPHTHLNFPST